MVRRPAREGMAAAPRASGQRPAEPRRADARRNRAAIVASTISTLRGDPDASVAEIAQAAGVGRVTLYGHFASRAELVEAALIDVLDRGNEALSALDLDAAPPEALARLVDSSWSLLEESRSLLAAAQRELPQGRVRELHDVVEARVRALVVRGQDEGAFRDDLPVDWLLATMHALMHGAADEIAAGRLEPNRAGPLLQATLLAAYAPQPRG